MKITEKQQEKSKKYMAAVEALIDRKDALHKQKKDATEIIASKRAELEALDERIKRAGTDEIKALRHTRRELQIDIEDAESAAQIDIYGSLKAVYDDQISIRQDALDEYNALDDIARAEVEAIKEKAKADTKAVWEAMEGHIFSKARRISDNIIYMGGWTVPGWKG